MTIERSALAAVALLSVSGCLQPPVHDPWRVSTQSQTAPAGPTTSLQRASDGSTLAQLPVESDPYPGRLLIGGRAGVNVGNGEPANDIPTFGLYGRYRIRGPWLIGGALDSATFDFEDPPALLELPASDVVDASIDAISVTVWGEHEFRLPDGRLDRLRPFAGAGLGIAFLSDDQITGPLQGGGTFDIDANGGMEIIPGVVGGLRVEVLRNLTLEVGVRGDYHFTELEAHDNIGGGTYSVDDYATYGIYGAVLLRL